MKPKILLTLIFTVLVQFCFGQTQTYYPFPDSNVVWIIGQDDGFGGIDYKKYYTFGDTLIDSCFYTKIGSHDFYLGAYRSDTNGVTYYIPKDSTNEYVIRDFSKNSGDTIKNVYYKYSYDKLIDFYVDSVNYVTAGPYLLKRMYMSNNQAIDSIYSNYEPSPLIWIEKIGCVIEGFYNNIFQPLGGKWLYCMSYDDTIYYEGNYGYINKNPIYIYGQCEKPDGLNEENQIDSKIIVTPNPFSDYITITNINNHNSCEYKIYSPIGQLIYHKKCIGNQTTLNLKNLNPGIYFFIINDKSEILKTQKIIKY